MKAISRIKAAQTRAKKTIEQYEALGYTIPEHTKNLANTNTYNLKKADAIVDSLSKETIRVLAKIQQNITMYESEPITTGHYKSGAKQFKTQGMPDPTAVTKTVDFTRDNAADMILREIKFIMKNAPSKSAAEDIVDWLNPLKYFGGKVFKETDEDKVIENLLDNLETKTNLNKAISIAEAQGYPAVQRLAAAYQDLTSTYGTTEKNLAARQVRIYKDMLDTLAVNYSDEYIAQDSMKKVVDFMIEHSDIWTYYRQQFKLKKKFGGIPDSNGVFTTIADVVTDNREHMMEILDYSLDLMIRMEDPGKLQDMVEEYGKQLRRLNDD